MKSLGDLDILLVSFTEPSSALHRVDTEERSFELA